MRQREPCWQKWTSSKDQRSMAGSCAHAWIFFYAPPAVGDPLWPPTGGATDNEYPPSGIGAGTGARSGPRHSVSASKPRDFFHPRDWPPPRPPPVVVAPTHAPPPIARRRGGRASPNGCRS